MGLVVFLLVGLVACSGAGPPGPGCEDLVCPAVWLPVCGADGKTYSNVCRACGVDVACEGECPCSGGLGDFCGDKSCGLKCSNDEKCVENDSIQCFRAPCCPRFSCAAPDLCAGKRCGEQCDTSLGFLQVVRYCQPDGSCGSNARPTCTENPCSSGSPLTDPSGDELNCGRGPNRVECPTGSSCQVHPTDRYAVCCPQEAAKQEGESCGSCFCPPTYSAADCAEGLTCERDQRLPDAPGICTRPAPPKKEGEECGSCLCPPTFTAGNCEEGLTCVRDERIPDLAGICTSPAPDLCAGKGCGEQCDTSLGLLQAVRYCQPDGSCGTNARPSCPAPDLCAGKGCGEQCDTTLGLLQAVRYCQPDGSCGTNARPSCPETRKKVGENCGSCFCIPTVRSCLCPPTFTAGNCEEGLTCVKDESIPNLAGICTHLAPDLCAGKGCGEQCDTSLGLLQAVRYCQPDGSCGTNARPSCPETRKKVGENCGSCFCPPTFSAGTCEDGLICKTDPRIPDRAGVCEPAPVKGILFPQK